jgi:hypothetical protein
LLATAGHREHREMIMSCGALCVLCGYSPI